MNALRVPSSIERPNQRRATAERTHAHGKEPGGECVPIVNRRDGVDPERDSHKEVRFASAVARQFRAALHDVDLVASEGVETQGSCLLEQQQ